MCLAMSSATPFGITGLLTGCSRELGEGHRPQLSVPGDALASLLEAPSSD